MTSKCHAELGSGESVHGPVEAKGCIVCHLLAKSQILPLEKKSKTTLETKSIDKTKADSKKTIPADHPKTIRIEPENVNKTCFVCHDDFESELNSAKSVHKVIADESCSACHSPHNSEYGKLLTEESETKLCSGCHKKEGRFTHYKSSTPKLLCSDCHLPHFSKTEKLLKKKQDLLCFSCHEKQSKRADGSTSPNMTEAMKTAKSIHKPITEGKCTGCHSSHGSTEKKLLIAGYSGSNKASEKPSVALCFKCHKTELVESGTTETATQFRNGTKNMHYLHLHAAKHAVSCNECHEVHSSNQDFLIREWFEKRETLLPMRFEKTANGGNCTTACHKVKAYDRVKEKQNEKGL